MRRTRTFLVAFLLLGTLFPATAQSLAPARSSLHVAPKPAPVRPDWKQLIGEYEQGGTVIDVLERNGRLLLSTAPNVFVQLNQNGPAVFEAAGTKVEFYKGNIGAPEIKFGVQVFKKRLLGDVTHSFHLDPLRPVAELRKQAMAARPPVENGKRKPDLVELTSLDPTIRLDIRYATTNNFMGVAFYTEARAFLQRPAAEALVRVNRQLRPYGYGLLIHDAYRPWFVTKMFWDATPGDKKEFVADPSRGSNHNRGGAVDLSLCDLNTGREIEMPGGYDEMSDRSYPDYQGGTSLQRWHRDLLRAAMESQGFKIYKVEWWHFDYKDWASYPILNVAFSQLGHSKAATSPH